MASTQSLHALLDQTGWIHALARKLVRDPHLAADLAQDTCVEALEHGPDGSRPLRGWLATVMRHQLAKLRRGDGNRAARERTARRGELEPAAHDVIEKAETHRNVVLAVLALAEPYRSTLLMRFFEQLSYDEIATKTGVSRAAVNSRVTRGLGELRAKLETTYGGDRRALGLALLPLARLPTGVATTTFLGLKIMHVVIGTAAATLLAATVTLSVTRGGREPAEPTLAPVTAELLAPEGIELRDPLLLDSGASAAEPARVQLPRQKQQKQKRESQELRESDKDVVKIDATHFQPLSPTVRSLSVNTGAGSIEVIASPNTRLEVQAIVRTKFEFSKLSKIFADHVEITEVDGVLKIEDKHRNESGWSVSLVVRVPASLPLSVNSGAGDVTVRHGRGKIMANTGAGDVRVELALERLQELNANSGAGSVAVEVASVEGELDANSGAGDVTVRVAEASSPGATSLNSGAGSVHLIVPGNIVGTFDLKTHGSTIELPPSFGILVKQDVSGQRMAQGTLGGGGGRYKLRSGAGDLRVEIGHALPPAEE